MKTTGPVPEGAQAGEPLLAITLLSSNSPIPMPNSLDSQLSGLALFKSRRREEGRERFRLHLGYFQNMEEAEQALVVVRRAYPCALIAAAPQANLGSLDNTALTHFSILQPPASQPQARKVAAPPAPKLAPAAMVAAPMVSQTPTTAIPTLTPTPIPAPIVAHVAAEPAVAAAASPKRAPAPLQRYAVQLAFGREPIDLAKLPELAIYEGYLLYAIESEPGGRRLYGVRLGFYDDVLSARLVAQYVRSEFKNVAIVPVSDREVTRATGAQIRLTAMRAGRGGKPSSSMWPRNALMVAFNPGSHLSLAT